MKDLSVYVHIPFCQHRCGYCDFNTFTGYEHLIPRYIQALVREIECAQTAGGVLDDYLVHTIYFGGGTPSIMLPVSVGEVLNCLGRVFQISPNCEITLEANPGTVTLDKFTGYHEAGVNRISLGVQSFHRRELKLLERQHSYSDVQQACNDARKAGFNNISVDLLYGLPFQKLSEWQETLVNVMLLDPEHFSLYSLTIEEGTPFHKLTQEGKLPFPDSDGAADMYDFAQHFLSKHGYTHYEISNWAKPNTEGNIMVSRHNCQYWRNDPYLGFGAGAHGFFGKTRLENEPNLIRYLEALAKPTESNFPESPATCEIATLDEEREMLETMMMGLRLVGEGVSENRFYRRFGVRLRDVFGDQINKLERRGLLEWGGDDGHHLKLTEYGYLLGNQVFIEFI